MDPIKNFNVDPYIPGYIQGLTKITLSYPFDTAKVYMQKEIYPNMKMTFASILKSDPAKLYRGSMLPYIIIPIECGIYYRYAEKLNKKYSGFTSGFLMGAFLRHLWECVYMNTQDID